ncbi:hypothetical protein RN001_008547 [Aquatica leii]|uniref:Uncharacterized protein n=1 Tax=Aquatica leii TaxID=1421715 RepID=A0AAN7PG51_9COLE|nr:hypothetical protein RN001_008547 [Aquatica leii]
MSSSCQVLTDYQLQQDRRKVYADLKRQPSVEYQVNDKVLITTRLLSSSVKQLSSKFYPRRDGPYIIFKKISPVSYQLASTDNPTVPLEEEDPQKELMPERDFIAINGGKCNVPSWATGANNVEPRKVTRD